MRMVINNRKLIGAVTFIGASLIVCAVSALLFYKPDTNTQFDIFCVSWSGNVILLLYAYFFYKLNRRIFTPFNILVVFMFLFNWGQCLMWSVGIHIDGEIGDGNLFSNYSEPSCKQIVDGQLFTMLMMAVFLFGALLIHAVSGKKERKDSLNSKLEGKVLFNISAMVAVVVIPLTFYRILQAIAISFSYGYAALYYGDANIAGGVLTQIEYLFFPVLVGMLIGSNYSKRTRRVVYFIFALYMILYLLAGERGNWLYKLVLLVWLDHTYHKPIEIKKLLKYSVIGILALYLVYAVVSLRNTGLGTVTVEQIAEAFSFENFPVVSAVFEMGKNMGITVILLAEGSKIWTGYNTYLAAILGMPATFWLKYFGIDFVYLENWFSQDFLRINWGSGFSFIGEAFINGGLYFAFVYVLLLGMFIAGITKLNTRTVNGNNVLLAAFRVISCNAFTTMMRGSCHSSFKAWFLGAILFLGVVKIISILMRSRTVRRVKTHGFGSIAD